MVPLIPPNQLFQPQVRVPRVVQPSQGNVSSTVAYQNDTFQTTFQQPAIDTDHDENLPNHLLKDSFVTKLVLALKSPLELFSSDPNQIVTTSHKDAHGNFIRLTREAGAGLAKIMSLAKSRGIQVKVTSAYRSVDQQEFLWERALTKYGSTQAARKWVAPPGKSRHNYGKAIDMHLYRQGKKISQKEFDEIIALAGMYRPMSWEGWHVEPLSPQNERGNHSHEH